MCSSDYHLSGGACVENTSGGGEPELIWSDRQGNGDWYHAFDKCSILGLQDGYDWRVPTKDELGLDKGFDLWTSTSNSQEEAWGVLSEIGGLFSMSKTYDGAFGVRCVRDAS